MRYLSAGESHGPALTAVIEGLPAGLEVRAGAVDCHLARRQGGYGRGGRMKIERDRVTFLSGLRFGLTTGSPLTLQILNRDWENWQEKMALQGEPPPGLTALTRPRPGHADLAGGLKYDHDDLRLVLERSSARETAMRVAVGSVARLLLEHFGMAFFSHVTRIGAVSSPVDSSDLPGQVDGIEASPLRCPDAAAEKAMMAEVDRARSAGDTLGGVVEVLVTGLPPGLGSHVHWDRRLDGRICGALASIQGIKGVEVGAGFAAAARPGSEVHDPILPLPGGGVRRPSNRAGGLEGGITNGEPLVVRAAMKPIPTLLQPLPSIDWHSRQASPGAVERADTCAVPAAAVVAEAVVAWELALAFREKFAGDCLAEVGAAYTYYLATVRKRLCGEREE